jgi:hypothetical protein
MSSFASMAIYPAGFVRHLHRPINRNPIGRAIIDRKPFM